MGTTPPLDAALSLETMIKGYTLIAAYRLNLVRELGSLEVGNRAYLIVLTENHFEMDAHGIHNARIDLTMPSGETAQDRPWRRLLAE